MLHWHEIVPKSPLEGATPLPLEGGRPLPPTALEVVFERALEWTLAHQDCFDPRHPFVQDHQLRVKPFLELVFVLNPCLRMRLEERVPALKRLCHFIDATFADYDFAAFAQNDPAGLMVLALRDEYFTITRRGGADQNSQNNDGLLERFLASGLHERVARSRIPFRVMDLRYALDRASGRYHPETYLALYGQTVVAKGRGLSRCTTNDLYSITHTLFYLADLGLRPLAPMLGSDTPRVTRLLEDALAMMLRQKNLDLAGEFMMCLGFLGLSELPIVRLAWSEFQRQQLERGAVPSPTYRPERQAALEPEAAAQYTFTQCYHTTLVTLGAAALGSATLGLAALSSATLGSAVLGQTHAQTTLGLEHMETKSGLKAELV